MAERLILDDEERNRLVARGSSRTCRIDLERARAILRQIHGSRIIFDLYPRYPRKALDAHFAEIARGIEQLQETIASLRNNHATRAVRGNGAGRGDAQRSAARIKKTRRRK